MNIFFLGFYYTPMTKFLIGTINCYYIFAACSSIVIVALPIPQTKTTNDAQGENFVENVIQGEKLSQSPGYLLFTAPYKLCEGGCSNQESNFAMAFPLYVGDKGKKIYRTLYPRDFVRQPELNAPFKKRSTRQPITPCSNETSTEESTTEETTTEESTTEESTTEESTTEETTTEETTTEESTTKETTTKETTSEETTTEESTTKETTTKETTTEETTIEKSTTNETTIEKTTTEESTTEETTTEEKPTGEITTKELTNKKMTTEETTTEELTNEERITKEATTKETSNEEMTTEETTMEKTTTEKLTMNDITSKETHIDEIHFEQITDNTHVQDTAVENTADKTITVATTVNKNTAEIATVPATVDNIIPVVNITAVKTTLQFLTNEIPTSNASNTKISTSSVTTAKADIAETKAAETATAETKNSKTFTTKISTTQTIGYETAANAPMEDETTIAEITPSITSDEKVIYETTNKRRETDKIITSNTIVTTSQAGTVDVDSLTILESTMETKSMYPATTTSTETEMLKTTTQSIIVFDTEFSAPTIEENPMQKNDLSTNSETKTLTWPTDATPVLSTECPTSTTLHKVLEIVISTQSNPTLLTVALATTTPQNINQEKSHCVQATDTTAIPCIETTTPITKPNNATKEPHTIIKIQPYPIVFIIVNNPPMTTTLSTKENCDSSHLVNKGSTNAVSQEIPEIEESINQENIDTQEILELGQSVLSTIKTSRTWIPLQPSTKFQTNSAKKPGRPTLVNTDEPRNSKQYNSKITATETNFDYWNNDSEFLDYLSLEIFFSMTPYLKSTSTYKNTTVLPETDKSMRFEIATKEKRITETDYDYWNDYFKTQPPATSKTNIIYNNNETTLRISVTSKYIQKDNDSDLMFSEETNKYPENSYNDIKIDNKSATDKKLNFKNYTNFETIIPKTNIPSYSNHITKEKNLSELYVSDYLSLEKLLTTNIHIKVIDAKNKTTENQINANIVTEQPYYPEVEVAIPELSNLSYYENTTTLDELTNRNKTKTDKKITHKEPEPEVKDFHSDILVYSNSLEDILSTPKKKVSETVESINSESKKHTSKTKRTHTPDIYGSIYFENKINEEKLPKVDESTYSKKEIINDNNDVLDIYDLMYSDTENYENKDTDINVSNMGETNISPNKHHDSDKTQKIPETHTSDYTKNKIKHSSDVSIYPEKENSEDREYAEKIYKPINSNKKVDNNINKPISELEDIFNSKEENVDKSNERYNIYSFMYSEIENHKKLSDIDNSVNITKENKNDNRKDNQPFDIYDLMYSDSENFKDKDPNTQIPEIKKLIYSKKENYENNIGEEEFNDTIYGSLTSNKINSEEKHLEKLNKTMDNKENLIPDINGEMYSDTENNIMDNKENLIPDINGEMYSDTENNIMDNKENLTPDINGEMYSDTENNIMDNKENLIPDINGEMYSDTENNIYDKTDKSKPGIDQSLHPKKEFDMDKSNSRDAYELYSPAYSEIADYEPKDILIPEIYESLYSENLNDKPFDFSKPKEDFKRTTDNYFENLQTASPATYISNGAFILCPKLKRICRKKTEVTDITLKNENEYRVKTSNNYLLK